MGGAALLLSPGFLCVIRSVSVWIAGLLVRIWQDAVPAPGLKQITEEIVKLKAFPAAVAGGRDGPGLGLGIRF